MSNMKMSLGKTASETNPGDSLLSDFDLETYISRYNYDSETRLQRLLLIAQLTSSKYEDKTNDQIDVIGGVNGSDTNNRMDTGETDMTSTSKASIYNNVSIASNAYQLALSHMKAHGNVKKYKEIFGFEELKQKSNTSDNYVSNNGNTQDPDYDNSMDIRTTTSQPEVTTTAGSNTFLFKSSSNLLFLQNSGKFTYDEEWTIQTIETQQTQLETLESRLSSAQAHLNKEAIRTAFLSLHDFFLKTGQLRHAMKYLIQARDYCTGNAQIISLCLDIATLGIDSNDWRMVDVYIKKAENTISTAGLVGGGGVATGSTLSSNSGSGLDTSSLMRPSSAVGAATHSMNDSCTTTTANGGAQTLAKIHCITALAHMKAGEYLQAALKFACISQTLTNQFHNVIAPEDIALYGSILGLASMDRNALRSMIIESNTFQQRLELLPKMRDSLRYFERADYGQGLRLLYSMESEMRLDLHLGPHVDNLFSKIKERCMVLYFYPYSCVSLKTMGECFFMTLTEVEEAVEKLILEGRIKEARINAKDNTLIRRDQTVEKRGKLMRKVKRMGNRIMGEAECMMIRLSCLDQELIVHPERPHRWENPRSQRSYEGGLRSESMPMYDDDLSDGEDVVMMDM